MGNLFLYNAHMTKLEIADAVIQHALTNYEEDGWDFLVECFTRDEIAQTLHEQNIVGTRAAITHFQNHVKLLNERRREVESEIF